MTGLADILAAHGLGPFAVDEIRRAVAAAGFDTSDEQWRDIPGFPNYQASTLGRVRHVRVLTPTPNRRGYYRVSIGARAIRRVVDVHRAVALAFLGPRPEGQEVRHLDDDKSNNALTNLVYGTRHQNQQDSIRNGTNANLNKTHCPQGHPYEGDNLLVLGGKRHCRACRAESRRRYLEKAVAQ